MRRRTNAKDAGPEVQSSEWQQMAAALACGTICWGRVGRLGPLHALDMSFAGAGSDTMLEQDGVKPGVQGRS